MEVKTYGLESVKTANVDPAGDFPTTGLTELCRTYRNSCEFTEDDPTVTDEFSDQSDDPVMSFSEKGSKTVKFSSFDYSPEALKAVKGGTILNGDWLEPVAQEEIIKAVEISTKTGLAFKFPKARISAKFNAKLVQNGMTLLEVTVKPLSPAPRKPTVIIGSKTA